MSVLFILFDIFLVICVPKQQLWDLYFFFCMKTFSLKIIFMQCNLYVALVRLEIQRTVKFLVVSK